MIAEAAGQPAKSRVRNIEAHAAAMASRLSTSGDGKPVCAGAHPYDILDDGSRALPLSPWFDTMDDTNPLGEGPWM